MLVVLFYVLDCLFQAMPHNAWSSPKKYIQKLEEAALRLVVYWRTQFIVIPEELSELSCMLSVIAMGCICTRRIKDGMLILDQQMELTRIPGYGMTEIRTAVPVIQPGQQKLQHG